MCATGHSEVAELLSTMAETLGKEVLTSEDTNNWNPGMFVTTNSDRHTLSFQPQISFKSVSRLSKVTVT